MNVPVVKGKPKREDAPGPTHEEMRAFVSDAVSEVLAAVRAETLASINARLAQALNRQGSVLAQPEEILGTTARFARLERLVNQMAKIHTEQWGHSLVDAAPPAITDTAGENDARPDPDRLD